MSKQTATKIKAQDEGDGDIWSCPACTITVLLPELVVDYPTEESSERKDIDRTPNMPDIALRAHLKNYNRGTVNFEWNLYVQWNGPSCEKFSDGRPFSDPFHGYSTAENSEVSTWRVDWNNITRGGDEITLDVTASTGGYFLDKTVNHPFKIVGLNPSPAQVKEGLTLAQKVLIYQESVPKWCQFGAQEEGYPSWGYPDGWGLMQVDPPSNEEQVWNWKANIAAGKVIFDKFWERSVKLDQTKDKIDGKLILTWPGSKPPSYEEALRDAYNLYNTNHHYYRWRLKENNDPQSGYWKGFPPSPKENHQKCYADECMDLYNNPTAAWKN